MLGIVKSFGSVRALDSVDFELPRNEVHVLAGENGAGKTTLMNVLAGLYGADAGSIEIDGAAVTIGSPRDAIDVGIGMVHQHFELVGSLTALDNVILGREGGGWRIDHAALRRAVQSVMEQFGVVVNLDTPVRELSIGEQQKIEILKSLYQGAKVLILDEPTTHLTPQEVDGLFGTIRTLLGGGLTVVLITHKLREIRGIGDRVTVMRRGRVVGSAKQLDVTEAELVEMLMGERETPMVNQVNSPVAVFTTTPLLELRGVTAPRPDGHPVVDDCSLVVNRGEIVGVAGVAGNGQRELAECIMGLRSVEQGDVTLNGSTVTNANVGERIRAGLAYIPEDGIGEGILPHASVSDTMILGPHLLLGGGSWFFDDGRARELTRAAVKRYAVATPSEHTATARLSGGNIQKLLIARAMLLTSLVPSSVLIAMNPTRGLDIRTSQFVHQQLLELRAGGNAVLLVSEDLDELLRLTDRLVVMYRGRIAGQFSKPEFDAYRIGALMAGGDAGHQPEGTSPGH